MKKEKSCVIVVENLPVPLDRRVWQEAQSLHQAGWTVSVICPKTKDFPKAYEIIDDIAIYRHWLPFEARGKLGFIAEYAAAIFHEFRLLVKVKHQRGFAVIQACNPPDLIFLAALPFKLFGTKFIYDQHDLCPELFVVKYGRRGFVHKILTWAERLTYGFSDAVVTANQSFKDIATSRGGQAPDDVTVVYSIPDASRMRRTLPDTVARGGRKVVLGYVGIIGDQDGVDHFIKAVHSLVTVHGQSDFRAVVVGDGPALNSVKDLSTSLGLDDYVHFSGYLRGESLMQQISDFDVGVIPDPPNESNELMSMNKVFEYSAVGMAIASYGLTETKNLLGDAAVYATESTPEGLALACLGFMSDDGLRQEYAVKASTLAAAKFVWANERAKYTAVYERVLDGGKTEAISKPTAKESIL